jgi:nitroimidazol reductase NimA-like FMN-containing flavoprotein (pyridoxamine 5'-phosphate oxidase superfamily)
MNFGYAGGDRKMLFFHCANKGKKLDMIRINNYVCFEIDTDHEVIKGEKGCDWGMKYNSIVGYGKIFIITDEDEKINGLDKIMTHYGGKEEYLYDKRALMQTTVLRLEISEITGKRK